MLKFVREWGFLEWVRAGLFVATAIGLAFLLCSPALNGCSEPFEDGGITVEVVPIVVPASVLSPEQEPTPEPPDWEDVIAEMRESLPAEDGWADVPEARIIDVATGIVRLSKERALDPVIVADEVSEVIEAVTDLQPALVKGWDGGLPRAAYLGWFFYRAQKEIGELRCHQLSDAYATFDTDNDEVPRPNAFLLAVMAFRESSLALRTERGYDEQRVGKRIVKITGEACRGCVGPLGERGPFQFMPGNRKSGSPGATERRFMPDNCPGPFDPWCAAQTTMKALAVFRCECIAEYGSRCNVDSFVASYGVTRLVSPENARHYRGNERARALLCAVREDCDQIFPRDHDDNFALSL